MQSWMFFGWFFFSLSLAVFVTFTDLWKSYAFLRVLLNIIDIPSQ